MTETENCGKDVGDGFDVVVPALAIRSSVWGASLSCEPDRLLDGEGWEMDVILGRVLNIAAVMYSDLLGCQGTEVGITLDVMVGIALVCEHLEERRTPRPWTPQYNWMMCVSVLCQKCRDKQIGSRSISPGLTTPLKSWRIVLVDGGRSELLQAFQTAFGLNIDPTVS